MQAFPDRELYFTLRNFIPGATLREVLESGRRFEPAQAFKILRQVVEALTPLHRDALVHGGVKPSNLFLTRNDRVVLGNPSLPIPASGWDLPRLAYDFRYMPPELFRSGGQLVPASDLYSLGCVAHELFRGQPPFVSDSHYELITRHDRDPAPSQRGSLSEAVLDAWLQRLLAKLPAERFPDLGSVLIALDGVEEAFRPRPAAPGALACEVLSDASPTLAPEAAAPAHSSVHLLHDQSLMEFAGRQSIVPLTGADGGLVTGPGNPRFSAPEGPASVEVPGYEILGVLGRGGMGVVYKARQVGLDRIVALKMILHAGHASDADRLRFLREARSVARLAHPHILQIYDLGSHDDLPYFAMEYCDGGSLSRKINGQPLEPQKAAQLVEALARAAHHAHEHDIVHRDIKPSNVLLTAEGTPKLTDFGLAKQREDAVQLTHSGAIVGTPSYMAPEQARGRTDIGPATDIYALGSLLYECLTGNPPFHAASVMETLQQVMTAKPPPPSRLAPGVPRQLDAICLRCLDKNPGDRYPTAEALAEDLRRFLEGPVSPAAARRLPAERQRAGQSGGWRSWWPFRR